MSIRKQIDLVEGVSRYFKPTALVAKILLGIIRSHQIQRLIINAIALSQAPFIYGFAFLRLMLTTVPVSIIKKLSPLARGVSVLIKIPEKYYHVGYLWK
jgi:hypothetical protein